MPIYVAIIEDDKTIREGIAELISAQKEIELIGSFEDAESFMKDIEKLRPDVALIDIELPGHSGISCVQYLKPRYPGVQFMMFTVFNNPNRTFDALFAGATGYILKSEPSDKIIEAIKEIHKGNSPMSPQIARFVVDHFNRQNKSSAHIESLSPREREVLAYLSRGFVYKEIADKMTISVDTVRSFIRKIYEKLHVHNRTEAINKFREGQS
ncbi:MAG: response regulator transcription factor [Bacteroidetes bacterium]|nr:response regulator transcription factor [Bacteroidota bacterium]